MVDKLEYKRKNPFVMLSHDFIKCNFLNWNEKDIYIILLMYADSEQKCFPSVNTLCKVSGKTNKTIIKALKGLEEKHLLKKETRVTKKGQTSNLYTLYDFESVWEAERIEQVSEIISTEIKRKQLYELARELNYVVTKEKELESTEPTKVTVEPSTHTQYQTDIPIYTTKIPESQVPETPEDMERYTMDDIKQFFEYDILITDHSEQKKDIDIVFTILYDTLNCTKPSIRVDGQEKPSMIVISRLMKLEQSDLWYAIEKYHAQRERIKNVNAYLLTILYHVKEQSYLDLMNLGHYNGHF